MEHMNQNKNLPNYQVIQNELGYQEIKPKPTSEELQKFYNSQYFNSGTYSVEYSNDEMKHKKIFFQEAEFIVGKKNGSLLDIGCGEGFSLNYFASVGWKIKGVDFTNDGVKRHFPELQDKLEVGDILLSLENIIKSDEYFDLIICNNVLEHVIDPLKLLTLLKQLCKKGTICRIQVPNDNSWLQKLIVSKKHAQDNYWVDVPSHLTYFNKDNLTRLLAQFDFKIHSLMGDFPIELFLLNESSNYKMHPKSGSSAHMARLDFDNTLSDRSIDDLVAFRKGCGQIGLGRNLIVYCGID